MSRTDLHIDVQRRRAMAGGVLIGHFAPHVGERLQPLGDAFIKVMRLLIAPIVFTTVVLGMDG